MNKITLLDCTLRDGGYVNDWHFGNSTANCIFDRLTSANVDIIEVGFIDERQPFNIERTIQPDSKSFNSVLSHIVNRPPLVLAMIDYGTCSIDRICPCEESTLDGIRLIFKKPNMHKAIDYAKQLMGKGYMVCLQLVSTTSYSDRDILNFTDEANKIKPYAISIVDTYGLMHKEDLLHYFKLLDYNLSPDIILGYHSHNNFQLAYANTIEMIAQKTDREVLVDGTLYGMGKSAGNAPTELIAMHLNENYNGNYDLNQLMEIIDTNILSIYREKYWGYSMLYYLSAANDCHPNYINYLLNKKTLSITDINEIIKTMDPQHKLDYDSRYIEDLYYHYQKRYSLYNESHSELEKVFENKNILLLGPGHSIKDHYNDITEKIESNDLTIISVNCLPDNYPVNYVFLNNSKRYSLILSQLKSRGNVEIIATSNISSIDTPFNYVLDYESHLVGDSIIRDNALIMFLNFIKNAKTNKLFLAGFDGLSPNTAENYYDEILTVDFDEKWMEQTNEAISEKLPEYEKMIEMEFITESLYDIKMSNQVKK